MTKLFVPKVTSAGLFNSESNSFVPIYLFSYPKITQYPESIFLFYSLLSSSWLRKRNLFQSKRKKLRKMKADGFLFFSFFMERKWDEKRKCNNLPALNFYPVASYISKAATSVPLSDHYFFLFCAHKVYTMLNAIQILQCHPTTKSPD